MSLEISNLWKTYVRRGETHTALCGVSFTAPLGAFVTLLGPSGCGKSTLLNMLAGLDRPSSGRININGTTVYDADAPLFVPPGKRNISMVFQSYAIWPHMTVRENVSFPLLNGRNKSKDRPLLEKAVSVALEKVHLTALADRPAPLLSGGQQQRVSLARAIAQSPSLILLDANLREAMQKQIRDIVTEEGITAVYVTHDQKEALAMSDQIIVMSEGRIEQIGSPHDIYYSPSTRFVAQFMGAPNLLDAVVSGVFREGNEAVVESVLGKTVVSINGERLRPGDKIALVLRQEDFKVEAVDSTGIPSGNNHYVLPVKRSVFLGGRMELLCAMGDATEQMLSVYVNARAVSPDSRVVALHYPAEKIHYIKE
jgi:iron(III) transport system ATP-binding protein